MNPSAFFCLQALQPFPLESILPWNLSGIFFVGYQDILISNPNFFTNFNVFHAITRSYSFSLSGRAQ